MLIPIGARIDRKTWEITPLYREGTADELREALRPFCEMAYIGETTDDRKGEIPMPGATR